MPHPQGDPEDAGHVDFRGSHRDRHLESPSRLWTGQAQWPLISEDLRAGNCRRQVPGHPELLHQTALPHTARPGVSTAHADTLDRLSSALPPPLLLDAHATLAPPQFLPLWFLSSVVMS